jgi:N-acyl-D-amino-acid deacylase
MKLLLALLVSGAALAEDRFDIIIKNGSVYDGSGGAPRRVDIGIRGERIAAIGDLSKAAGERIVDAKGKYVAPGFIDVHTHTEEGLSDPARKANVSYLTQGVTTVVAGNCGTSPLDFAATFAKWREQGIGTNAALLVGHGSVRRSVMRNENRAPSPTELDKMKALVERAMEDGAIGLSTGLFYEPGFFAKTDEVVELAKISAKYRGVYTSHIRSEGTYSVGVETAVAEAIEIGKQAGLTVEISHLKALGPEVWGLGPKLCATIETARANGQRVYADQYPYIASGTSVGAALFPRGAKIADFDSLRGDVEKNIERRGGANSLFLSDYRKKPEWNGKSLEQIAQETGRKPVDVAKEVLENGGSGVVSFNMADKDVDYIMQRPYVMTASDGSDLRFGEGVPHPRSYGTYPRKLRNYVLDRKLVTMENGIRAASGLPAEMLQLKDRGLLKAGYFADVVVFDPATIREIATFTKPHQYSEGVDFLLVNGKMAIENGKYTGALAGQVVSPAK